MLETLLTLGLLGLVGRSFWVWIRKMRQRWQGPQPGLYPQIMVVLGSGGHTTEMLQVVAGLDTCLLHFVVAQTDQHSAGKLKTLFPAKPLKISRIYRAREVKQSYLTSPFSVARALGEACLLIAGNPPDLLLVNGPGLCLPLVYALVGYEILGLGRSKITYIESICRTQHLSLTGYLVYLLADDFLVQWESLTQKYRLTTQIPWLL